ERNRARIFNFRQQLEDGRPPLSSLVIVSFRKTSRRRRFSDDPFDCLRMIKWKIDYTDCQPGRFLIKRAGERRRAAAVFDHHESPFFASGERGLSGFKQEADLALVHLRRQRQNDALSSAGRKRALQTMAERMIGQRNDLPVTFARGSLSCAERLLV